MIKTKAAEAYGGTQDITFQIPRNVPSQQVLWAKITETKKQKHTKICAHFYLFSYYY